MDRLRIGIIGCGGIMTTNIIVNLRKNARFFLLVGASCARDIGRTVASTARSYRRR